MESFFHPWICCYEPWHSASSFHPKYSRSKALSMPNPQAYAVPRASHLVRWARCPTKKTAMTVRRGATVGRSQIREPMKKITPLGM
jgi:hypothetical protein